MGRIVKIEDLTVDRVKKPKDPRGFEDFITLQSFLLASGPSFHRYVDLFDNTPQDDAGVKILATLLREEKDNNMFSARQLETLLTYCIWAASNGL